MFCWIHADGTFKKGFYKSMYIKWSCSDKVEKMATLYYLPECTGNRAQTYKTHRKNTKEYTV